MSEWQDYPDTGFDEMDDDHRVVSELSRQLLMFVSRDNLTGAGFTMCLLLDSLAAHFLHEEHLMAESRYAEQAGHKAAHDTFLSDARGFHREMQDHGLTPPFREWAGERITPWFRTHAREHDHALREHLAAHQERVSPSLLETQIPPAGNWT